MILDSLVVSKIIGDWTTAIKMHLKTIDKASYKTYIIPCGISGFTKEVKLNENIQAKTIPSMGKIDENG